jgi:outer membrane lipoprotein-sorting protein
MKKGRYVAICLMIGCIFLPVTTAHAQGPEARERVRAAFDHYRGKASRASVEMVIHRPSWERSMTMDAWTKGTAESLIRITSPAKDEGNGTLKKGHDMWTYNPKVNRVIKLPPSLMSQSWMGSDFSNNDLSKTDSILNDYTHTLKGTEDSGGHTVYVIQSMPKPGAPVVWGKQELKIRDDDVMLSQIFFDESMAPVKKMTASDIRMMGGRIFPATWKMQEVGKKGQYTLLRYHQLAFLDDLPDRLFTVQELKTPRRR